MLETILSRLKFKRSILQSKLNNFKISPSSTRKVIYSYTLDKRLSRRAKQSSEIHWPYFHLGPLQGVIVCPPGFPVHTFIGNGGIFVIIDAIQVRFVTTLVPPSSFAKTGIVSIIIVIIILIASCKWLTTVTMRK